MNIILLHPQDFSTTDTCVLRDQRATHIRTVLKSAVGDTLRVGLVNGLLGSGTVTAIAPDSITLAVCLTDSPPHPLPLTLCLALPRPNMLTRLLRDVTSLGVKTIHLFHSQRVEKSFWQTPALQPDAVREKCLDGLAQAKDTQLPTVHRHTRFTDVLHTVLPALAATHTCVLADPFSPQATLTNTLTRPVALLIGPEGGFTPIEREQLLATGCLPLWLGSRILRVETATITAIGHLATQMTLP